MAGEHSAVDWDWDRAGVRRVESEVIAVIYETYSTLRRLTCCSGGSSLWGMDLSIFCNFVMPPLRCSLAVVLPLSPPAPSPGPVPSSGQFFASLLSSCPLEPESSFRFHIMTGCGTEFLNLSSTFSGQSRESQIDDTGRPLFLRWESLTFIKHSTMQLNLPLILVILG